MNDDDDENYYADDYDDEDDYNERENQGLDLKSKFGSMHGGWRLYKQHCMGKLSLPL